MNLRTILLVLLVISAGLAETTPTKVTDQEKLDLLSKLEITMSAQKKASDASAALNSALESLKASHAAEGCQLSPAFTWTDCKPVKKTDVNSKK